METKLKITIAVVESPLQFMCLPADTKKIFIRTGGCLATLRQFENLSLSPLFRNRVLNDIAIFLVVCYFRLFSRVAIIYGSYFSRFLKTLQLILRFVDVTFVDDGIASFKYLKIALPKRYNFLTIYDELVNGDNITKNVNFLNPIGEESSCIDLIIGQDLIEECLLGESTYFSGVKAGINLIGEADDVELRYFPHRRENVNRVRDKLEGVNVVTPDFPIEIYLLKNNLKVRNLITYFSSAAFNIKRVICPNANIHILRNDVLYGLLDEHQVVAYDIIQEGSSDVLS